MTKNLTIAPDLLSKVATLLHRQNPQVLSIERAADTVQRYVIEAQEKGRASETGTYDFSTAGFGVRYFKDEDGFEEVSVYLNVLDLWYDDDDSTDAYQWGALDRLKTVPSEA